ncbi:MAG TPA: hypothetical protein VK821_04970, partial [Dehalococcoidia bacterium]|nr:hypothetical protein [Dehalococcoidia bacterium]
IHVQRSRLPLRVACSTTAATTCSNGTTAYYGGQPCPATYASCSNGGQVLAGQQCSSVLGVSSIAPTNAYTSSSYTAAPGFGVSYAAGWNMVAGPTGTTLTGTSGPLYTWGSGSTAYGTQPSGSALSAGIGAWAYFRATTSTTIGLANPGSMTVQLPAGQFVMIGNSGDTTATVSGADSVFVYSSATGSYNQSTQLAAGQGAWAFSFNGGSATLTNSPA